MTHAVTLHSIATTASPKGLLCACSLTTRYAGVFVAVNKEAVLSVDWSVIPHPQLGFKWLQTGFG